MTHTTDSAPLPGFPGAAAPAPPAGRKGGPARRTDVRVSAAAGGAAAAALGLGALAALVLVLWIASPYPDSGLGGALHVGAGMWLLAQGAELVRTQTLSGDPAPIAVTPLLFSAVPAWLLYRGTSSAVAAAAQADEPKEADGPERAEGAERADGPEAAKGSLIEVAGWVLTGYLSVVAAVVAYAAGGPVRVDLPTVGYVALFAIGVAGYGAWAGGGRPAPARWRALDRRLGRYLGPHLNRYLDRCAPYAEEAVAALRAAGIALGVLLGGGALLGAVSLAWHAGSSGGTYAQLSGPFAGKLAVLLIAIALLPNLAVWGACYALGVGFSVGAGSTVGPVGAFGYGLLPRFPLLAALPGEGVGGWPGWLTLAVPAVGACAVGWWIGHGGWPAVSTVRVVAGAAGFLALAVAVLAAWSSGPLGVARLADFGPTWWRACAASWSWTVALALPLALLRRVYLNHPLPALHATLQRLPGLPRGLPHIPYLPRRRPKPPAPPTAPPSTHP
ncbi:DUF6350 family protein [Streptomyces sp. NBC_01190]|uniref:cell division protein PerM n=1 Tax=Streptomyces sp. NBC_01190 TaxID=2903767 RepID=UPI00386E4819|nr:DUF6350 family protein [Streptomyces sp. NBC_01190]